MNYIYIYNFPLLVTSLAYRYSHVTLTLFWIIIRTVGVQEVDFRIFIVSILNRLLNIDLVLMFKRLKNTNIKRLKQVCTI